MPKKIDRADLLRRLHLDPHHVEQINASLFTLPARPRRFLGKLSNLEAAVAKVRPEYLADINWLKEQVEKQSFIRIADYRKKVTDRTDFNETNPVTMEISSCQYFPRLKDITRRAVDNGEIMPARFIHVRNTKEQEVDGDLPAFA